MSERTRRILIYMTLPLALIWGAYNLPPSDKSRAGDSDLGDERLLDTGPTTITAINAESDTRLINVEERDADAWGKDPFRCYRYASASAPKRSVNWILKGIVFSSDNPLAYVNGRAVRVGDTVNNAKVVAITKKTVTIDYRGRRLELSVNKG